MMKKSKAMVFGLVLFLVACGNKGDLYLPEEPATKAETDEVTTENKASNNQG